MVGIVMTNPDPFSLLATISVIRSVIAPFFCLSQTNHLSSNRLAKIQLFWFERSVIIIEIRRFINYVIAPRRSRIFNNTVA